MACVPACHCLRVGLGERGASSVRRIVERMAGAGARDRWEEDAGRVAPPEKKTMSMHMYAPIVYAPLLPLIRIGLRQRPVVRDRAYMLTVAAALCHAGYVMSMDSTV